MHPGGVIGGPFPFEWVTPAPGLPPDGWPWPVELPGPFPEAPDDAPEVPWLAEEPDEDPVEVVVGEEAVVVVDVVVPEPVGEVAVVVVVAAVVVELPEEGAVVVVEPSPGAEAVGAEVVPIGEAGPPAPGVLGALTAAGFAEEDGAAFEDGRARSPRPSAVHQRAPPRPRRAAAPAGSRRRGDRRCRTPAAEAASAAAPVRRLTGEERDLGPGRRRKRAARHAADADGDGDDRRELRHRPDRDRGGERAHARDRVAAKRRGDHRRRRSASGG